MGLKHERRPVDGRTNAADGVADLQLDTARFGISDQTSETTGLEPGFYGFSSTSTDETTKVWTVEEPQAGDMLGVFVKSLATTSSPMNIRLGSAVMGIASSIDNITLSSAPGGAILVALSSTRWGVIGQAGGATFTTST